MMKKTILCGVFMLIIGNASFTHADEAIDQQNFQLRHGPVTESVTWTIKISTAVKDGKLASGDQFATELYIPDGECRSVDLMNMMARPESAASAKVCVGSIGAVESRVVGWISPVPLQEAESAPLIGDQSKSAILNIQFEGARLTVDNQTYVLSARKVKKA